MAVCDGRYCMSHYCASWDVFFLLFYSMCDFCMMLCYVVETRLKSVKNIQKITKSMKMVAAAKLSRQQKALELTGPYGTAAQEGMRAVNADGIQVKKALLVAVTSDKGLCGAVNNYIAKEVVAHADKLMSEGVEVDLAVIGEQGRMAMHKPFGDALQYTLSQTGNDPVTYAQALQIADTLLNGIDDDSAKEAAAEGDQAEGIKAKYDTITVLYNHFKTVLTQIPTPITQPSYDAIKETIGEGDASHTEKEEGKNLHLSQYEIEATGVDRELDHVLQMHFTNTIFFALHQNATSEHAARMNAMESASKNASEMIDDLTLQKNRTRQAVITRELIEIISGAAAV